MRIRLLAPARTELDEAVAWYAAQAPGLEHEFLDEIKVAVEHMLRHPGAWAPMGDDLRRYRLARLPYGLIYSVEKNEIIIVAVAHLHRKPNYWRSRIPE